MTQNDLLNIARDASAKHGHILAVTEEIMAVLTAVAIEAAAREREECAKVCEDAIASIWEFHPESVKQVGQNVCTNLAAAIRARSKQ